MVKNGFNNSRSAKKVVIVRLVKTSKTISETYPRNALFTNLRVFENEHKQTLEYINEK